MEVIINKVKKSKISSVDFTNLGFCKYYSDHMFIAEYEEGEWKNFKITPFQDLKLSPACATLHYGQTIFEGLKAYKNNKDEILIFRAKKNAERFNKSAQRMCMPELPENIFTNSINELLRVDKNWVPKQDNSSLYIRPLMFAKDPYIGIKPADKYIYIVICGLAGGYYSEPVNVKIEKKFTRAIAGGVGYAKTAANYAAALYPAVKYQAEGYHQLIWTDGKKHEYVEESGTMNLFFVINGKLFAFRYGLKDRDSIISHKNLNIDLEVRKISVEEIILSIKNGQLTEAFGAGTAATIAPIKMIGHDSKKYEISYGENSISQKILLKLNKIKYGIDDDIFNWVHKI